VAHAAAVLVMVRAVAAAKPSRNIWTIVILSLLLSLPGSAYAASGMETPIAELLATAGAVLPLSLARPEVAAILVGLAAAFRPELAPWAMTVALGYGRRPRCLLIAAAPAVACALIRAVAFGSPAPLAVVAKPSDLASGLSYLGAALAISIAPLLLFAPRALMKRASTELPAAGRSLRLARVLVSALVVHAATVIFVGGDWMPFARLFAPVLPSSLVAFVWLAPHASRGWTNVRAVIALALAAGGAYAGRGYLRLLPERLALAEAAKPYVANAKRVATLDIGWPTLSTEADFVDLAGLTDAAIAALPGGHTSKRVDAVFLLNRAPDVVLLYTDDGSADRLDAWSGFRFPRTVEARLVGDPRFTKRVEPIGYVPIGSSGYVVLRVSP
jgi:hypothetical protein